MIEDWIYNLSYKGEYIRIASDFFNNFCLKRMKSKPLNSTVQKVKVNNYQPISPYEAILILQINREVIILQEKHKVRQFVTTKTLL